MTQFERKNLNDELELLNDRERYIVFISNPFSLAILLLIVIVLFPVIYAALLVLWI